MLSKNLFTWVLVTLLGKEIHILFLTQILTLLQICIIGFMPNKIINDIVLDR